MYATGDIVKTRQSAPYDHVPGWRIVVAVEVPAEHSDLEQVSGQAPVVQTRRRPGKYPSGEPHLPFQVKPLSSVLMDDLKVAHKYGGG
jgi:hypothetical protein